jgi:predicted ester cyclase
MQMIKEVAEIYANSVWNDKSMDAIETGIHHDAVIHSPLGSFKGPEAMKTLVQAWLTGFPDLHVENEILIAENDLVSIQWRASGTHKGEFKGKRPTGKKVSYSGNTVYRVHQDKIVEYWAYLDMQHLLNQI